jgi:hypothetical protein
MLATWPPELRGSRQGGRGGCDAGRTRALDCQPIPICLRCRSPTPSWPATCTAGDPSRPRRCTTPVAPSCRPLPIVAEVRSQGSRGHVPLTASEAWRAARTQRRSLRGARRHPLPDGVDHRLQTAGGGVGHRRWARTRVRSIRSVRCTAVRLSRRRVSMRSVTGVVVCVGAGSAFGQAASAWCHDGGQTKAFAVGRSGSLTTALPSDLRTQTAADVSGPLPAALAVWGSGVRVPSAPPR